MTDVSQTARADIAVLWMLREGARCLLASVHRHRSTITWRACVPIVFVAASVSALATPAPPKRSVDMEITLPNGAMPRVIVRENEGAIVKLPDSSRFGFIPTLHEGEDIGVVVEIWDVDRVPFDKLGSVEVEVGGPVVHSNTSPSFGIRILRVIKSK